MRTGDLFIFSTIRIIGFLILKFCRFFFVVVLCFCYRLRSDFNREYGSIVLEVTSNGVPIVNLYNRQDIEKVLRFPSKYPFRPPTEIVAFYRRMRPDRYASTGITNE